jgi:hypothetical protein
MYKSKTFFKIILACILLVLISLGFVYIPMLFVEDTVYEPFLVSSSKDGFNFTDNKLDIDGSRRYEYIPSSNNWNNPFNPKYTVLSNENESNTISLDVVSLKRDHLFDFSWEVAYPIQTGSSFNRSFDEIKQLVQKEDVYNMNDTDISLRDADLQDTNVEEQTLSPEEPARAEIENQAIELCGGVVPPVDDPELDSFFECYDAKVEELSEDANSN